MLNPRALIHAQLAQIVADVQAILWQESRMLPDFPRQYGHSREYGHYWNPAKESCQPGIGYVPRPSHSWMRREYACRLESDPKRPR